MAHETDLSTDGKPVLSHGEPRSSDSMTAKDFFSFSGMRCV